MPLMCNDQAGVIWSMCVYTCMRVHMCVHLAGMCVYVCVRMCVVCVCDMCVCTRMCVHACTYMCVCVSFLTLRFGF